MVNRAFVTYSAGTALSGYSDDFSSSDLNPYWVYLEDGTASASVGGGELSVTLPSASARQWGSLVASYPSLSIPLGYDNTAGLENLASAVRTAADDMTLEVIFL